MGLLRFFAEILPKIFVLWTHPSRFYGPNRRDCLGSFKCVMTSKAHDYKHEIKYLLKSQQFIAHPVY